MTKQEYKELLKLSGKLATACSKVVSSGALCISENIEAMEEALVAYNNAIFDKLDSINEEVKFDKNGNERKYRVVSAHKELLYHIKDRETAFEHGLFLTNETYSYPELKQWYHTTLKTWNGTVLELNRLFKISSSWSSYPIIFEEV